MLQFAALPDINKRFPLVVVSRKPEHICTLVFASRTQGYGVVHLPAWARTTVPPGERTRVVQSECTDFCRRAVNAGLRACTRQDERDY